MENLKFTLVPSEAGEIWTIDTIEHPKGVLWLVPRWVEVIDPVGQEPARAIRLSGLDYEASPTPAADYILKRTIPKGILLGTDQPSPEDALEVVDRVPDSRVAKPQ